MDLIGKLKQCGDNLEMVTTMMKAVREAYGVNSPLTPEEKEVLKEQIEICKEQFQEIKNSLVEA